MYLMTKPRTSAPLGSAADVNIMQYSRALRAGENASPVRQFDVRVPLNLLKERCRQQRTRCQPSFDQYREENRWWRNGASFRPIGPKCPAPPSIDRPC